MPTTVRSCIFETSGRVTRLPTGSSSPHSSRAALRLTSSDVDVAVDEVAAAQDRDLHRPWRSRGVEVRTWTVGWSRGSSSGRPSSTIGCTDPPVSGTSSIEAAAVTPGSVRIRARASAKNWLRWASVR